MNGSSATKGKEGLGDKNCSHFSSSVSLALAILNCFLGTKIADGQEVERLERERWQWCEWGVIPTGPSVSVVWLCQSGCDRLVKDG